MSFHGGAPSAIGPVSGVNGTGWGPDIAGTNWGPDDVIYFAHEAGGIYSVPASGGTPTLAVPLNPANGETYVLRPEVLPGGGAMLFDVSYGARVDDEPIYAIDLLTGVRKKLIDQGSNPKYVSSGHLVFARRGELFAAPFDPDRLEVTGEPVAVLQGVYMSSVWSTASYDVSRSGTLVYLAGDDQVENTSLILADQEGGEELVTEELGSFMYPKFSPNGSQLALSTMYGELWIYDLDRPSRRRLNFEGIHNEPVWTPDGERIAFASAKGGSWDLYWGRADGTGQADLLWESDNTKYPISWSPDGQMLAFEDIHADTGTDVSILRLGDGPPTVESFRATPFDESNPKFAPVGLWIAYHSNDSGQTQVYVEPYPRTGVRYPISTVGGVQPIWSRDGTQLFYGAANTSPNREAAPVAVMVVDIRMEPEFQHSEPRVLLEGRYAAPSTPSADVAPDGRFVVLREELQPSQTQLQVILNWSEELKRLVPTDGSR